MNPIICLAGPTASGKTALAVALAQALNGEVVSCEEHTVKPEPRIYEILLERYGLTPSETLFIDDREMNIEAAAALGIHGFVFDHRDPDAACDALRRRLLQSDCI